MYSTWCVISENTASRSGPDSFGRLQAGRLEHGRHQVERGDEVVDDQALRDASRPAQQQRRADAAVVERHLAARKRRSVVAHEQHERVLGELELVEERQHVAHHRIHLARLAVEPGELEADLRPVR
jgi:hypothetical protein